MADSSNGTTFTFDSVLQGDVRSVQFNEQVTPIPITVLGSSAHLVEGGLPKEICTIEVVGVSSLVLNATGALAIVWGDSSTDSLTTATLLGKDISASIDEPLLTSLTFERLT